MDLVFEPISHTYWLEGRKVPSVTQVLRPLHNFDFVPRAVLQAKQRLGTHVHECCELLDRGEDVDVLDEAAPYVDAYLDFCAVTGAEVIENECRVYHHGYRYAGTLDRVLRVSDELWVVDLKTSITAPIAVGPQTAAYAAAHFGTEGYRYRRGALLLGKNGRPKLVELDDPNDWPTFLACLTVHNHLEKHTR